MLGLKGIISSPRFKLEREPSGQYKECIASKLSIRTRNLLRRFTLKGPVVLTKKRLSKQDEMDQDELGLALIELSFSKPNQIIYI